jgi:hypothetical protein
MAASVNLATPKKEVAYGCTPGNMVAFVNSMVASFNLATTKKNGCAKNGPNTDHTWESIGDKDHTWESIGDSNYGCVH